MKITCPYCFESMNDDEVMFRSEYFTSYEDCPTDMIIDPDEYKPGADPEYDDWLFFKMYDEAEDDPQYAGFWNDYNGTTEANPADNILGVKGYKRKIINPKDPAHQKYLVKQDDGGYLIRDNETGSNMVIQIELKSLKIGDKFFNGAHCASRVCPHCHNPLPQNYGKFPVRYTTVIGITGAGKTVYISKLLEMLGDWAPKVGLTASVATPSARNFIEANPVDHRHALPASTPAKSFQQPIFYDILRDVGNDKVIRETFVLYDVAGEVFENKDLIPRFSKYIVNSDGLILLVDPLSIRAIANASGKELHKSAKNVLDSIYDVLRHNDQNKCVVPIAICIPKCDQDELQMAFGPELAGMLTRDVRGITIPGSFKCTTQFNAEEYNKIAENLHLFLRENEWALMSIVDTMFSKYAYFAFTALGCGTDESNIPKTIVNPRRIEEPLFWLFHQFNYIGANKRILQAVPQRKHCPSRKCGSGNTMLISDPAEQTRTVKKLFSTKTEFADYVCRDCGYKWDSSKECHALDVEEDV